MTSAFKAVTVKHCAPAVLAAFLLLPLAGLHAAERSPLAAASNVPKPNVILILADDLGYGDVSCYGNEKVKTPNIDRLAREGIRFADAHTTSSVCTPSRYSLLTGRYCWRTPLKKNVVGNGPALIEPGRTTLPSLFKEQGYHTAMFGKWHLGHTTRAEVDYNRQPVTPGANEIGFDYTFILPVGHFFPPYVYLENGYILNYNPADPISIKPRAQQIGGKSYSYDPHQVTPELVGRTLKYIRENKDQPFFIYLATPNVHDPLTPSAQFSGNPIGLYGDYLDEMDWAVGQVLHELEALHLETNTLVMFASDNGASEGNCRAVKQYYNPNHPLRGDKGDLYEGGHRLPLIARWPGRVPAGMVSDQFIMFSDLLASFAGYFHRPLGKDEGQDGNNLMAAFFGERHLLPERAMVIESRQGMFGLRQGDWMYLHGPGDGDIRSRKYAVPSEKIADAQLYNLRVDLHEDRNLVAQEPERAERMRQLLDQIVGDNATRKKQPRELNVNNE